MSDNTTRRAVQVLVGDFMDAGDPTGELDLIACFYGLDVNDREDGSIQIAYDLDWSGSSFSWEDKIGIEGPMTAASGLAYGDLDDNDTLDVVGTSRAGDPDGYIAWWTWHDDTGWSDAVIIADELDQPTNVAVGDIDDDGNQDVVATLYGPGESSGNGSVLVWYENANGLGTSWTAHEIDTFDHPYGVTLGYLDQDDTLDVVCTSTDIVNQDAEGVYIYYGLGTSPWFNSTPDVDFDIGTLRSPRSVRIGLIDDDALSDLVVSFTGDDVSNSYHDIIAVFSEDDGYPDVEWVGARSLNPNFTGCRDVYLADFDYDEDHDLDVAASSLWGHQLDWFACPDYPRTGNWVRHDVGSDTLAKGLAVGEFTGDNYPDIAAASFQWTGSLGYVYLYKNNLGEEDSPAPAPLSFTCASSVVVNGTLSYSYSFTLDQDAEEELYAWYKIVLPGFEYIMQSPVDTLGTEEDTYAGSGNISIPDSVYSVGDKCQLFFAIGHMVCNTDVDPPSGMLHGDESEMVWFEVISANETEGEEDAAISASILPSVYAIESIQPNPFNSTTAITITLPEAVNLDVVLYNLQGQRVATLSSGHSNAGRHVFTFDGNQHASGLYFVHAVVPDKFDEVRKLTLLK